LLLKDYLAQVEELIKQLICQQNTCQPLFVNDYLASVEANATTVLFVHKTQEPIIRGYLVFIQDF